MFGSEAVVNRKNRDSQLSGQFDVVLVHHFGSAQDITAAVNVQVRSARMRPGIRRVLEATHRGLPCFDTGHLNFLAQDVSPFGICKYDGIRSELPYERQRIGCELKLGKEFEHWLYGGI